MKASHHIEYLAGCGQRQAFTPAVILFIALPEAEGKADAGVTASPLQLLPRWCPVCGNQSRREFAVRYSNVGEEPGLGYSIPAADRFQIRHLVASDSL